jgi:hypothetical protein
LWATLRSCSRRRDQRAITAPALVVPTAINHQAASREQHSRMLSVQGTPAPWTVQPSTSTVGGNRAPKPSKNLSQIKEFTVTGIHLLVFRWRRQRYAWLQRSIVSVLFKASLGEFYLVCLPL